ncbi:uncharacterized protein EV420DRAFT_1647601 [Desarmillaria tabescens]|uniref:Uncharacterized protein n=1 Tax=Armillaria tabescens TaxID=1929756 RepID=A0AA39MVR7_ARMTA|nr:uncharacterized protein EV420DRAFT_1647601 [Desarmillaria tabescens]KAK0447859.1 hypothetical protein EV420DRAFT_1647601 [Desarmillaria tabescens]
MALKNDNPRGSTIPSDHKNAVASPVIGTPPHWADFYQLPVENDIIAGTEWIYSLWAVLHRAVPPSYHAFTELDETSRELCNLLMQSRPEDECLPFKFIIKAHTRTKTLHAIYEILECQGYLQSVCPTLINDILQEIQACDSDSVTFSADLRRRCKISGPILEHKMWSLQKVVIRQHRNLNFKNHARFVDYLFRGLLTLALACALLGFVWSFFGIASDSRIINLMYLVLSFCPLLAMITSNTSSYASKIVSRVDTMNMDAFKLIWAVRDMAGLLALIAESDASPLTSVSHAKRFIEAFELRFWEDVHY